MILTSFISGLALQNKNLQKCEAGFEHAIQYGQLKGVLWFYGS
jgi:hypothetical protein